MEELTTKAIETIMEHTISVETVVKKPKVTKASKAKDKTAYKECPILSWNPTRGIVVFTYDGTVIQMNGVDTTKITENHVNIKRNNKRYEIM